MSTFSVTLNVRGSQGALYLGSVLVVWFGLVLVLGNLGVFEPDRSHPPLAFLIAIAGPPLLFGVTYLTSTAFRTFVLGLDLRLLTVLQSWRVLGAMFVVLYAYGLLPGLFAWPAGLGDLLVGLAAPFAAASMIRNTAGWHRRVLFLNLAGLLDFVGAVGTGLLTSGSPLGLLAGSATSDIMNVLPLSLIPTFAVPFFVILHFISLLQLRRLDGETRVA
jgi:hypothetical protein